MQWSVPIIASEALTWAAARLQASHSPSNALLRLPRSQVSEVQAVLPLQVQMSLSYFTGGHGRHQTRGQVRLFLGESRGRGLRRCQQRPLRAPRESQRSCRLRRRKRHRTMAWGTRGEWALSQLFPALWLKREGEVSAAHRHSLRMRATLARERASTEDSGSCASCIGLLGLSACVGDLSRCTTAVL